MVSLKVPSTIVFGQDVLPQLGPVVSAIGSRALVVSESVLHEGQHIDRVLQILKRSGVETMIYDELMPGSPASRIDEIASLARASKAKAVVGLGGMRVLSIARCVANVATETKRIGDMMEGYVPTTSLPYVEVPSSYRNHLLMRDEAVIKDTRAGRARMVRLAPNTTRAAIIDTAFTQTLSSKYALAAILDTLLAAVEGFYSPQSTMYSDTLLLKATSELHKAALSGIRNPADPRFRLQAAEAGFLTAMGLAVTGQGIGGGLAYAINARFSLPKSWVAGILLPHAVDLLTPRDVEKAARVAAALDEPVARITASDDAPRAARGIRKLLTQLDLPPRLRDLDVTLGELGRAAEDVADFPLSVNVPGGISSADLQQLVASAF
jgi:alcohol dehydrogenase class IV